MEPKTKTNRDRLARTLLTPLAAVSLCLAAGSAVCYYTLSSTRDKFDITAWTWSSGFLDNSYREALIGDARLHLHSRRLDSDQASESNNQQEDTVSIWMSPYAWYQNLEPSAKFHWTVILMLWLASMCLSQYHNIRVWRATRRIKNLSWLASWRLRNAMSTDLRPYFTFLSPVSQLVATCAVHTYNLLIIAVWPYKYVEALRDRKETVFRPSVDFCTGVLDKTDTRWEEYEGQCTEFMYKTVPLWNEVFADFKFRCMVQWVVMGPIFAFFLIRWIYKRPEVPYLTRLQTCIDFEGNEGVLYARFKDSSDEKTTDSQEYEVFEKA